MPAPSESEVRGYLKTLSNWGRWGSEDELGTINLITPAKRQAAARLVSDGESVTCARPITTDITADTTVQPMRFMVDSGEGRDTVSPERTLQRRGAAEFIGMVFHGYTITHVDAPVALLLGGPALQRPLVQRGDVARGRHRQLGRGAPRRGGEPGRAAGRRADPRASAGSRAGVGVMPEDLEAAERAAGVRVESGDILLVRTGYYGRRLAEGPVHPMQAGHARRSTRPAARGCGSVGWR